MNKNEPSQTLPETQEDDLRFDTSKRYLPVKFEVKEIVEMAGELARTEIDLFEVEADKGQSMKEFKEQINSLREKVKDLTIKINEGSEQREVVCKEFFHYPETGLKAVYRLDSEALVNVEPMTAKDKQPDLFVNAEEQKGEKDDV